MKQNNSNIPLLHKDNLIASSDFETLGQNNHDNNLTKYDKIVDDLGISQYNLFVYIVIALFVLADGGEMMVIALITNKLNDKWNLSSYEKGMMGSSVFFGFFMGSLVSGKLSDIKGRKPTFFYGSVIITVFAFLSSLAQNYQTLILLRSVCGFGIGVSIPAIFALATEITPTKYRAYIVNCAWVFFPIGVIVVVIFAKFTLDYESGWRYVMFFACLPCFAVLVLSCYISESPKFLFLNKRTDEGWIGIQNMIIGSEKKDYSISEKDKQVLINELIDGENAKITPDFNILITEEYKYLSILLWVSHFTISFVYYGVLYILPQSLTEINDINITTHHETGSVYGGLILSALTELPSYVIAGYLANMPSLGRIKSMALGFGTAAIASMFAFALPDYLSFWAGLIKFGMGLPFNIMLLYTCEAYPTKIRGIAVGTAMAFTRFGGMVTPIISQLLFDLYYQLPYFFYIIASVVGGACTMLLPFETLNRKIS